MVPRYFLSHALRRTGRCEWNHGNRNSAALYYASEGILLCFWGWKRLFFTRMSPTTEWLMAESLIYEDIVHNKTFVNMRVTAFSFRARLAVFHLIIIFNDVEFIPTDYLQWYAELNRDKLGEDEEIAEKVNQWLSRLVMNGKDNGSRQTFQTGKPTADRLEGAQYTENSWWNPARRCTRTEWAVSIDLVTSWERSARWYNLQITDEQPTVSPSGRWGKRLFP